VPDTIGGAVKHGMRHFLWSPRSSACLRAHACGTRWSHAACLHASTVAVEIFVARLTEDRGFVSPVVCVDCVCGLSPTVGVCQTHMDAPSSPL
jgi:hypothetical protein